MFLHFSKIAKFEENERCSNDRRFRGELIVCEYIGDDGEVYRKAFYCRTDQREPIIPKIATHEELNAWKYQYMIDMSSYRKYADKLDKYDARINYRKQLEN